MQIGRPKKGAWFKCQTCGKEFYRPPCYIRQGATKHCSMACYTRLGFNNPFWGRKHSRKSIKKMKQHPNRPKFKPGKDNPNFIRFNKNYIPVGKDSAGKYRKGKISHCERCGWNEEPALLIAHHKDNNRFNNTQDNLIVLCPTCHSLSHYRTNRQIKHIPFRTTTKM